MEDLALPSKVFHDSFCRLSAPQLIWLYNSELQQNGFKVLDRSSPLRFPSLHMEGFLSAWSKSHFFLIFGLYNIDLH